MNIFLQGLDDSNGCRFNRRIDVPVEAFPDWLNVTLEDVKSALIAFHAEPAAPEAEPRKEHARDSDEANHRRQEPLYKLLVRLDESLHRAAENRESRDEASVLHGEVHDAAFTYVTEVRREQLNDDQIKYMADRFLGWRLPENFSPDAGISFTAKYTSGGYPMKHEPTGTNLFDADQAEEMVRYMIDGMPDNPAEPPAVPPAQAQTLADQITRAVGNHTIYEQGAPNAGK